MKKKISTKLGILVVFFVALIVGIIVFFYSQEVKKMDDPKEGEDIYQEIDKSKEKDEEKIEEEVEDNDIDFGENDIEEGEKKENEEDSAEKENGEKSEEEKKVEDFVELRLTPFMEATTRTFGRGRFSPDIPSEDDLRLIEELDNVTEYFTSITLDRERELDYQKMITGQEKIEEFYEFLIENYPEDAERMKTHDEGRKYDNSGFFEV